jgi:hypothetical protein
VGFLSVYEVSVADEERFELSVPLPVRILSRDVVSATHPLVLL